MLKNKDTEVFNDGIINILSAVDGVIIDTLHSNIHFGNRTYGVKRFFEAKVAGSEIERLISIPFNDLVTRENLIELKEFRTGKTFLYEIVMFQPKFETAPQSIYLTLKRTEIKYVDTRRI